VKGQPKVGLCSAGALKGLKTRAGIGFGDYDQVGHLNNASLDTLQIVTCAGQLEQ
jgi:hypothetical protein